MPKYMLFLHMDEDHFAGRSAEDMQKIVLDYRNWANWLRETGRWAGGERLADGVGKVLRKRGGKIVVTDGPYAESKEVVGGFFLIEAKDDDDIVEIAKGSPQLKYDGRIEIRAVHE